jgi:hypothetical protein
MSATDITQMDFFELGDKTSLICADAELADSLRANLNELGFKYHAADSSDAAIDRLRYTQYDCVLIQESFAGSTLRTNAVLNYLATLPMNLRRNSFVCLIGPSFKTLDAMQSFARSVHMVVNPVDLPNLTAILKKGLAEFESMYRIYKIAVETLADRRAGSNAQRK